MNLDLYTARPAVPRQADHCLSEIYEHGVSLFWTFGTGDGKNALGALNL